MAKPWVASTNFICEIGFPITGVSRGSFTQLNPRLDVLNIVVI